MPPTPDSHSNDSSDTRQTSDKLIQLVELLSSVSGLSPDDLTTALQAASDARQSVSPESSKKSVYQDRELVYDDEQAFIFRRGTTKSRIFYIRIYDSRSKRPFVKSLGVTDRVAALTKARLIYQEIKGKVERGERLKSLTNRELVRLWEAKLEKTVTDIPRQGITPDTFKLKRYFLKQWLRFIESLGCEKTPIDQIRPERTREFCFWFFNLPREDGRDGPRSVEQVNNAQAEVLRMFRECAVRDRYLSRDQLPEIDRLKEQPDERYKRDILEVEQYERLMKWMWNHWARSKPDSSPPASETAQVKGRRLAQERLMKSKRLAFFYTLGFLYNTGLRPKEFLGLRVSEITSFDGDDPELSRTHLRVFIRATNSKTGRSRVVVAPVLNRVEKIKAAYEQMGFPHQPTDFLLFNPHSKSRAAYTRQSLYTRLQEVLELSGLKEELASVGKKISLYSSRHAFITWRLRFGNVPIHLLAKVAGTSIQKIESTYGHIQVEQQASVITRNQGHFKSAGFEIDSHVEGEEV